MVSGQMSHVRPCREESSSTDRPIQLPLPGPWPGHPAGKVTKFYKIGPPGGDHRDGRPKTFHRKGVLRATASLCFQAKTQS